MFDVFVERLSVAATAKSPTGSVSRHAESDEVAAIDTHSQSSKSSGLSRRNSSPTSVESVNVLDRLKRASTSATSKHTAKSPSFSRATLDHSTNLGATKPIFEENEDQLFSNGAAMNDNQFMDSTPKSAAAYQAMIWEAHAKNLDERLKQARQNKRKAIQHFTNIEKHVYKVQLEDLTRKLRESIKLMQSA